MKKFTNEEINLAKNLAEKYGYGFNVDTYGFCQALLFYNKDMNLDDKHRMKPYRDEKGMYHSEHKYFIFRTNKKVYKYHTGFLYWNDQKYKDLWKTGEEGFWDCMSLFGRKETFQYALNEIEHYLEKNKK